MKFTHETPDTVILDTLRQHCSPGETVEYEQKLRGVGSVVFRVSRALTGEVTIEATTQTETAS